MDPGNNAWIAEKGFAERAATKWAARWMFWLQNLLELHTCSGSALIASIRDGYRAVGRNWGLVVLVLLTNLLFARVLAGPLREVLERDLRNTGSSVTMMNAFDHDWWKRWTRSRRAGRRASLPTSSARASSSGTSTSSSRASCPCASSTSSPLPPSRAMTVHHDRPRYPRAWGRSTGSSTFSSPGGCSGCFRSPGGGWTLRGLVHGSGFYFGRLFRVALLALFATMILFLLNRPLAGWVDQRARESVSEATALVWLFGRHALLFLGLLLVHAVSSFAKVAIVLEERSSAFLAFLTSLGFTLRNLGAVAGQYAIVGLVGALLLAVWAALDARWVTTGYKSQLVTLVLFQVVVLGRIALRLEPPRRPDGPLPGARKAGLNVRTAAQAPIGELRTRWAASAHALRYTLAVSSRGGPPSSVLHRFVNVFQNVARLGSPGTEIASSFGGGGPCKPLMRSL